MHVAVDDIHHIMDMTKTSNKTFDLQTGSSNQTGREINMTATYHVHKLLVAAPWVCYQVLNKVASRVVPRYHEGSTIATAGGSKHRINVGMLVHLTAGGIDIEKLYVKEGGLSVCEVS